MRTKLFLNHLLLIFIILAMTGNPAVTTAAKALPEKDQGVLALPGLKVTLKATNNATILFKAKNGKKVAVPATQGRKIPHLVLNRNGVLTPGFERTLLLSLENLTVPKSGLYAHLVIETQHSNPDLGRKNTNKIRLWEDTKFIPYSAETQQSVSVDFKIAFQEFIRREQRSIRTPTDYYSYDLKLLDSRGNILQELHEEYA